MKFPRINVHINALDFDRSFLAIITVLYIVVSSMKITIYWSKYEISKQPKLWAFFVLGAPFVPIITNGLLQVLMLSKSVRDIKASLFALGMAIFLILFLLRIVGIYRLFIATALRESAILRILNNLLLYFYGGHLFGGLWYFFSVWKKMQCWYTACMTNYPNCQFKDRGFYSTSGGYGFLDVCFHDKSKDMNYELGIFKDALLSHIVDTKNLGKKLLFCLRWGIQNLSGFGQNLEVSTHAWENVFVLILAVYGMATFTFLIGNMQDLLKSPTRHSTRRRREDLANWFPLKKLSEPDKNFIVARCEEYNWPQSGALNVKNLLANIPDKTVRTHIKHILCSSLLRKVPELANWSDGWIHELCGCAGIVSYEDHTVIVKSGNRIEKMVLVVEGKVRKYFITTNGTISREDDENQFICGETLARSIRISDITVRAVGSVEAFVISSEDLEFVMNQYTSTTSASDSTSTSPAP